MAIDIGEFSVGILKRIFGGHGGQHDGGHHGSHGGNNYRSGPLSEGGISCPDCRALNELNARFCQQCSASLVTASCARCGTTMQAGAKFCGQCGKPTARSANMAEVRPI